MGPQCKKLLDVLRKVMDAIGYSVDDMEGISPSVFMHRTFLGEVYKLSRKPQTCLNSNMQ